MLRIIENKTSKISLIYLLASYLISCSAPKNEVTQTENGFITRIDSIYYQLELLDDNIVHVFTSRKHPDSVKQSVVVDQLSALEHDISIEKEEHKILLKGKLLNAVLDKQEKRVAFYDNTGNRLLEEAIGGSRLTPRKIDNDEGFAITQSFILEEDEAIYGFGQHQDGLMSHRGKKVEMYQHNMKVAVPIMVSSKGYGLLWDNYSYTTFTDNEYATWASEIGDGIDYYFIHGPKLDSVVSGIRDLTGKAPIPPKWAFGLFQSKARYKTQDEVLNVIQYYRKNRIPLDVIVQDWQYWPGAWGAKEFDSTRYPNPKKMMDDIHASNTKLMISVWPCLEKGSRDYKEMDEAGFLFPGDGRRYYDAYNKEARDLYWQQAKRELFHSGVDAWWCDATEPEINGWETDVEDYQNMMTPSIGSATRYLNLYSYMHSKGMYENQRKFTDDKRVFNLTRSAFIGQQRFGTTTWSGDISADWQIFENQISAGLNFSLTGLPYWTTDIGAFFVNDKDWFRMGKFPAGVDDPNYHEIFVRWYQFGAFSPIFRVHGAQTPREIWCFGEPGDWAYDTQLKYNNLRYRLLPYIYSQAGQVTFNNASIMKALVMDFASDSKTHDIGNQYMFGSSFLVKPVTLPKVATTDVYLPEHEGGWYNFWTGRKYLGGQTVTTLTPIDIMPLFVKAGSIIPMGPFLQYSNEKPADPIELRIYPGVDTDFVLYEDEGTNYNYEKGIYRTILINWNDELRELTIGAVQGSFTENLKKRTFKVVIVDERKGIGVNETADVDSIIEYDGNELVFKVN